MILKSNQKADSLIILTGKPVNLFSFVAVVYMCHNDNAISGIKICIFISNKCINMNKLI